MSSRFPDMKGLIMRSTLRLAVIVAISCTGSYVAIQVLARQGIDIDKARQIVGAGVARCDKTPHDHVTGFMCSDPTGLFSCETVCDTPCAQHMSDTACMTSDDRCWDCIKGAARNMIFICTTAGTKGGCRDLGGASTPCGNKRTYFCSWIMGNCVCASLDDNTQPCPRKDCVNLPAPPP